MMPQIHQPLPQRVIDPCMLLLCFGSLVCAIVTMVSQSKFETIVLLTVPMVVLSVRFLLPWQLGKENRNIVRSQRARNSILPSTPLLMWVNDVCLLLGCFASFVCGIVKMVSHSQDNGMIFLLTLPMAMLSIRLLYDLLPWTRWISCMLQSVLESCRRTFACYATQTKSLSKDNNDSMVRAAEGAFSPWAFGIMFTIHIAAFLFIGIAILITEVAPLQYGVFLMVMSAAALLLRLLIYLIGTLDLTSLVAVVARVKVTE